MSLIIAENITHAFGSQVVLKNLSFRISPSERIGLVGPNGEGKTTLLRIIGGLLESTQGEVHRSRGLRMGYLPQTPPVIGGGTIRQTMLDVFSDLRRMEDELHQMATQLECGGENPEWLKRYGDTQTQIEALGGYDYQTRIEQVLTGLAFERSMWDRSMDELSGGQRTRVYLATLLLKNPDVLLLDEPTNHLDLDTIEWLEYWLSSFSGALIAVSHDRYFLDHATTSTWEIAFGNLEAYRGSYSVYIKQQQQRQEERMRQWEAQQEYVAKTEDFIARHLAGQRSKEAKGRRTRLERFLRDEAINRPVDHQTISVSLTTGGRTGDIVLRAENLVVGYEVTSPLLKIDRLEVIRQERIAIVGANGTGKTTLLRTLMGQLKPLAGNVHLGANVNVGYLSQTHVELDLESTALAVVMAAKRNCTQEHARSVLGSLLLSGDDAFKQIKQLSGGQRSRVALARLMMQNINVLMLDEPTNHLDISSTQIMQDVLQEFNGTIIFVSHDRYLVQAVATHIWAIDSGEVRCILGGWEDFLAWRQTHREKAVQDSGNQVKEERKTDYRQSRKDANLLQRLKRRHEEIEMRIQQVEQDLATLNQGISTAGQAGNLGQVEKLGKDYQQKDAELKTLWNQWEQVGQELEEKLRITCV
ncbi:MAG: ABC-F family ATP-binding cassette domain-containing protein [Phycisphaerae bacterium]